jgi:hypothetical protein
MCPLERRVPQSLTHWPGLAARELIIGLSGALGTRVTRGRRNAAAQGQEQVSEASVEYLRRMYASTRGWYTAAETKAQLLLAVNGAFVTLLFGILFSRPSDVQAVTVHFGVDTWAFISMSVAALVGAIVCATLSLWSLHGRAQKDLTRLGVSPGDPDSYRPEALWYFGHVARLQPDAVTERLLKANSSFEAQALSYHAIDLARRVLRKHRWVNAGWILTAAALIALAAAGTSFFIHAQI